MEVTVSELRSSLKDALEAAKSGDEVIITERGIPVARLSGVGATTLLQRLEREGLITPPAHARAVPRLPQAEAAKDALSSLLGRLRR